MVLIHTPSGVIGLEDCKYLSEKARVRKSCNNVFAIEYAIDAYNFIGIRVFKKPK